MQYLQKVCVLDIFFGLFSREGKQVDIILSQLKNVPFVFGFLFLGLLLNGFEIVVYSEKSYY